MEQPVFLSLDEIIEIHEDQLLRHGGQIADFLKLHSA